MAEHPGAKGVSTVPSSFARAMRRAFERSHQAWNEGDFARAYQGLGDDVDYNLAATWPQAQPLRGRAEVVKFFEEFREAFPDVRSGPLEFIEVTERRVIVGFPVAGTGRASGASVEMEIWQVWDLGEGGVPVQVKEYANRQAALSAAEATG